MAGGLLNFQRERGVCLMPVVVRLDVVMARKKVSGKVLAQAIGVTEANLSLLKRGHVKGIRFETLSKICKYLDCKPGDILDFVENNRL